MDHPTLYEAVDRYLDDHRQENLQSLRSFLTIPSVSTLSSHATHVRTAAAFLADRMRAAGLHHVTVFESSGHPIVYGAWTGAPGKPTALVYGHYDVQPADPIELWTSPPFEPEERDGKLYARGATDDKGQVWMHLMVAEAFLKLTGRLPLNLKFVVEGEEEVGSKGLASMVAAHPDMLAADVVVISDTSLFAENVPSICYGLRGNTGLELHVRGPSSDLHSGLFGGSVANPLHALAELIAGLHTPDGRVAVDGFYRDVRPLSDDERNAFARLPFDEAAYRRNVGVEELFGERGYTTYERVWARPTLEVNGMWGGFQGEGGKTIVPAEAHAKITCRLVPDQDPCQIQAMVKEHLERHRPPGVRLSVDTRGCGSRPIVTPLDSPYVQAASRALGRAYGTPPMPVRMGGSIPIASVLSDTLHAPLVFMGFGLPTENLHAPNEHFTLSNYDRGERALAAYWLELGGA